MYTWITPSWRIRVEQRKKIRRGAAMMVVSNHQSQLDILVIFRMFFHFKFVSKSEIFRVPFIGWNMLLNRYIKLVRGDKESVDRMMKDCGKTLDEGSSVFIFPEGTRSAEGFIKSFKSGAFVIAHKKKVPILPVLINGTKDALPKYSMKTWGVHKIRIRVLDEIPYDIFSDMTVDETSDMVRSIMEKELEKLKNNMGEV